MNKMFKKIFAVVAACATVATMSVSAFAAATANHDNGTVSVSGYEAVTGATQYTVMVFSVAEGTTDLAAAVPTVDTIYYINQGTELYDETNKDGLLDTMLVKATDGENALPAGNYAVRIGNDANSVVTLGLTVTAEVTFMYGDVNGDGVTDMNDALQTLYYSIKADSCFDDGAAWRLQAGDVIEPAGVDLNDALQILYYSIKADSSLDDLLK